jgi:hypothetical protein
MVTLSNALRTDEKKKIALICEENKMYTRVKHVRSPHVSARMVFSLPDAGKENAKDLRLCKRAMLAIPPELLNFVWVIASAIIISPPSHPG